MPWASPEQAEGRSEKIDVRSDVYSLGVILYQALTGRFPYDVVGPMREVLDNILTIEPVPPRKIRRQIDEDVERIVLKCLQKDRDRRYQSAAELVRDIHHYLNGEPIEARRDSVTYVVHMHLRRHKLAVAIIVPFIIAAAVGSVTSALMWRRAARESAEATAALYFLESSIAAGNPDVARNKDLTVREMLDRAADKLNKGQLEDQPAVNAAVQAWIGKTYLENGDAKASEAHLRSAVTLGEHLYGADDLRVAENRALLGRALIQQDRLQEAARYLDQALAVQERRLKKNDNILAMTLNGIAVVQQHTGRYDEAEKLFQRLIDIHSSNNDLPDLASAQCNMAVLLDDRERLKDAEGFYKKSLETYTKIKPKDDRDPDIAFVQAGYGWNLILQGRACEAIDLLEKSWKTREQILQESDWRRAWTQSCLGQSIADCPSAAGRGPEAEQLLLKSWQSLRDNALTPPMARTLALARVASFYESRGDKAMADKYRAQR
jgi:eukaryotic-like serine/threonine-protein kinase